MKSDGHLGRCQLKGPGGDAANIVFTAVDHNLRLTLSLAEALLRLIRNALLLMLAVALELRPQYGGLRDQIVCGSRKVAAMHQALVPLKGSTIKNKIEASVPQGEINRGFERATMHQLGRLARLGPRL
ncbi:hypothetical protein KUL72_31940 [Bradyrhizobium arachidis]|uniref:hypothetical protein n=1 Tax=Bradyrhizobium arachidis TaxID=858423 RepID=UPI0022052EE0|nr:hypothetical protein KUL72_31940 [Bradyrhizobium arachidis]